MSPTPNASFRTDSEQRNPLIAGYTPIETKKYTLASGLTLALGAIIGVVLNATPTSAAAAGNTGNGTIGSLSLGAGARAGTYRVICVEPNTNLGTFAVEDPDGVIIGRAIVGSAFAGAIGFTIADGATDFVAGDSFTVTVAETGYVKRCASASTDGSHRPVGIVAQDCDASAADAEVLVYTRGDFDETLLTIGAGLTVAGAKETLRQRGIYLTTVASA